MVSSFRVPKAKKMTFKDFPFPFRIFFSIVVSALLDCFDGTRQKVHTFDYLEILTIDT